MCALPNSLPLIRLFVIISVKICSNMLVCLLTFGDVVWNGGFRFRSIPPTPSVRTRLSCFARFMFCQIARFAR